MAFNPFKKKKAKDTPDDADASAATAEQDADASSDGDSSDGDKKKAGKDKADGNGFKRNPKKAAAFFRHATATADSRQYDYSIDCYVNGLRHDPENMIKHEELEDVAKKRLVGGGKKAGIKEQMFGGGKDPVDKMLHAEMLWAKDPRSCPNALAVMKRANEAHKAFEDLDLAEVVHWIGEKVIELNMAAKKPSQQVYLEACDLFHEIGSYEKAVEACVLAVQIDDQGGKLLQKLKDLEAEKVMHEAQYDKESRASVKDLDEQEKLDAGDQVGLGDAQLEKLIQTRREEHEADPDDHNVLQKLIRALLQKNDEEADTEAIDLCEAAFAKDEQYRYKMQAGDIKIRRFARKLRDLKKEMEAHPEDAYYKDQREATFKEKLQFELTEFAERVKNYPTDLKFKYQYGQRLFAFKKYDEAIEMFQIARTDPKIATMCDDLLGQCYMAKGWLGEAIETFQKGIDAHPLTDDKLGLDMRYRKMNALDQRARANKNIEDARDAQAIASQILQANINYRDIRARTDALRKLVEELG